MSSSAQQQTISGEFWNVLQNPDGSSGGNGGGRALSFQHNVSRLAYLNAWYDGTVFGANSPFRGGLIQQFYLYVDTRVVWNPYPDIIDFWAGIIYPGNITEEMDQKSAIPLKPNTPPRLAAAAYQFLKWGNWNVNKNVVERYNANCGNALVVIEDDIEHGRVYPRIVWPAHVKSVSQDTQGNVKSYVLEYPVDIVDDRGVVSTKIYREEADAQEFRTFLEDKPHDFSQDGRGAVWPNEYGFVPAVYKYHKRTLTSAGIPAVAHGLAELAAINSIESHLDDQVHKAIDPDSILWGGQGLIPLLRRKIKDQLTGTGGGKRGQAEDDAQQGSRRDHRRLWAGPMGGQVDQLTGAAEVSEGGVYLEEKKKHWLQKYPEKTVYDTLRTMPDISGRAAEILLGDITPKVVERRAEADPQTVKMMQMGISIGGLRRLQRVGGWGAGKEESAQSRFDGFDLSSYGTGALQMEIDERPFVPDPPLSAQERVDLMLVYHDGMGVNRQWLLKNIEGKDDAEIAEMLGPDPIEQAAQQKAQADAASAAATATAAGGAPAPGMGLTSDASKLMKLMKADNAENKL